MSGLGLDKLASATDKLMEAARSRLQLLNQTTQDAIEKREQELVAAVSTPPKGSETLLHGLQSRGSVLDLKA